MSGELYLKMLSSNSHNIKHVLSFHRNAFSKKNQNALTNIAIFLYLLMLSLFLNILFYMRVNCKPYNVR
jgi:hypothetical protein